MISVFEKLTSLLDSREKFKALLLFSLILIGTFLEVLGVGALLPLVTLLSKPDALQKIDYLNKAQAWVDLSSTNDFIILCLAIVLVIYILKNAFLFLVAYVQGRFLYSYHLRLSSHLFRAYINNPYSFHLKRNSAELLRNLQAVSKVIHGVFFTSIILVTEATVMMGLFALLLWADPRSAVMITIGMGTFLGVFYYGVRRKLTVLGDDSLFHTGKSIQLTNEGIGSIKEIKILGRENKFIETYHRHMEWATTAERIHQLITQSPRYYIESITITIVLGAMILLLNAGQEAQSVLVVITLFAAAAARIMPSASRCTWAMGMIRFNRPNLDAVHKDFLEARNFSQPAEEHEESVPFKFDNRIELKSVSYRYQDSEPLVLENVSMVIPKNSTVGFVGASGAGKTTAVDLIIGLMSPTVGHILVDDKEIHEKSRSWKKQIGYIPQEIFLTDASVKSNVALGMDEGEMDEERVWKALRRAQLEGFIDGLPEGLNAMIGEKGVRLSGGQRQRIGIARALYHDPQVLVMDEATAALDNETERAFMEAIENFSGEKTIILIAHRLTTVKNVDTIHFLKNGQLLGSGPYETILRESEEFRKMAQA